MKTSTLRKLPVPFVLACLLGVAVLSFLLFTPSSEQEKTAQAVATSSKTKSRAPSDSSRYGSRSGVAKLVRSSGNTSRTSSQTSTRQENRSPKALASKGTKTSDASTKSVEPSKTQQKVERHEIAARPKAADRKIAQQKEAKRQAAERLEIARKKQAKEKQAKEARVASTTAPRRDLDGVKSATVAATTQPASNKSYSPENTDPSELLSQALGSDSKASAPVKANEPGTVIPPGFDSKQNKMTAPKLAPSQKVAKSEPTTQGSTAKTAAVENTDKPSVVTGELKLEAAPAAAKRVVRIINPSDNSLPVWFVTQKYKIQLKPGQRYEVSTDEQLHVRFARGGDFGVDRVVAEEGDWVFSVNRTEGWKLTQN